MQPDEPATQLIAYTNEIYECTGRVSNEAKNLRRVGEALVLLRSELGADLLAMSERLDEAARLGASGVRMVLAAHALDSLDEPPEEPYDQKDEPQPGM